MQLCNDDRFINISMSDTWTWIPVPPRLTHLSIPHITQHPSPNTQHPTTPLPINPRYTTDSSWRDLDRIPEEHPNLSGSESNVRDSSIRARDGSDWVYSRWMDGHTACICTCTCTWSSCFNQDWRDWFRWLLFSWFENWEFQHFFSLSPSSSTYGLVCWEDVILSLNFRISFLSFLLFVGWIAVILWLFPFFLFLISFYTPTSDHDQISTYNTSSI